MLRRLIIPHLEVILISFVPEPLGCILAPEAQFEMIFRLQEAPWEFLGARGEQDLKMSENVGEIGAKMEAQSLFRSSPAHLGAVWSSLAGHFVASRP